MKYRYNISFEYDGDAKTSDLNLHYTEKINGETYKIHKKGNDIISKINIKDILY